MAYTRGAGGGVFFSLLPLFVCASSSSSSSSSHVQAQAQAQTQREVLFDQGWRFHRGDDYSDQRFISHADYPIGSKSPLSPCTSKFCNSTFDDSTWRQVEVPHDWSIEDLPDRDVDIATPVVEIRNGTWLFHTGDGNFSNPATDDSSWIPVTVPHDWRDPPLSINQSSAIGWYRRHFPTASPTLDAAAARSQLYLALGTVAGSDDTYLNGQKLGNIGSEKGPNCKDYLTNRRYDVPQGLLRPVGQGENVVAVRVVGGSMAKPGGLFDSGDIAADIRSGAFDPGASPGQKATGYTVSGVGWYRKGFTSPPQGLDNARVSLRFDAVYMLSEMWLNEKPLGLRPYGYTTFEYDITDLVKTDGSENVLAVKVSSMGRNSRWYAGAGIFRHVHLITTPAVHIATWGVAAVPINDEIDLQKKTATVVVTTSVQNEAKVASKFTVHVTVKDDSGATVCDVHTDGSAAPATTTDMPLNCSLSNVRFWSPDSPSLYTASVIVTTANNGTVDSFDQTFGIRKISFDSRRGFVLNGVSTKLQGGCVHHTNGPLGSKSIDRAEERRVQILKNNGYNAIRTSHNPPSPAFVAACDRLGVLLMEEAFDTWEWGKNPDDYHLYFAEWWPRDMASMVLRDRNSPSIIMWSIGNEISMRDSSAGHQLSKDLSEYVRTLDPQVGWGRAVTSAVPGVNDGSDEFFEPLDVAGYNYSPQRYQVDHVRDPDRVIVGTESFPHQSYDYWDGVWENDWVIGDFIWTAMDYIGESAIGGNGYNAPVDLQACDGYCPQGWSWHVSFCGDIDLVGNQKAQAYYRMVLWNVSKIEIAVHAPVPEGAHEVVAQWGWPDERKSWTWSEIKPDGGQNLAVNVYTKASAVDLLLNGIPVTDKPVAVNSRFTASFDVGYSHGNLTAVAYSASGGIIGTETIETAEPASAISLVPDRPSLKPSRGDLSYVSVSIVDASGRRIPEAEVVVSFSVSGDGELEAVGSGDPSNPESFSSGARTTYRGLAMAIVRPKVGATAGGTVTLTASAPGFPSSSVTIIISEN